MASFHLHKPRAQIGSVLSIGWIGEGIGATLTELVEAESGFKPRRLRLRELLAPGEQDGAGSRA